MFIMSLFETVIVIALMLVAVLAGMAYQKDIDMTDKKDLNKFEKKFDNFIGTLCEYMEW